ncbi:hypothetical protein C8R43DRAFT_948114 [Mycena crocata]|nr:hypothetical protein C8R43DRAFT_948114 [Mycena crocata]
MCSLPEVVKQPGTPQALFKHLAASLNPSLSAPYLSASIVPQPPWYIIHRHTETRCTYPRANILPAYYLLPSRILGYSTVFASSRLLFRYEPSKGPALEKVKDLFAFSTFFSFEKEKKLRKDIIWRHTIQPYYKREVPPRTVKSG